MEKVLVIGANGKTGRNIVKIIDNIENYDVKLMLRKKEQKDNFDANKDVYIGDLEKDFKEAFTAVDKVIFAAGSGSSTGEDKTIAIDQNGAKKAIDYAVANNLKKFVMLSSMGTDTPEKVDDLAIYLKAKKNADDYLKSKNIDFSIVQPGMLTNENAQHKIKQIEGLSEGSVSREDVAYVLVKCLDKDICTNKSFGFVSGNQPIDEVLIDV